MTSDSSPCLKYYLRYCNSGRFWNTFEGLSMPKIFISNLNDVGLILKGQVHAGYCKTQNEIRQAKYS